MEAFVPLNIACKCIEIIIICIFSVSHHRQLESAVHTLGQTLRHKARVLGNFAHEMRTPLVGVQELMQELIEEQSLEDAQHETVVAAKNSTEALVRLIDALSKISSQDASLAISNEPQTPFDVRDEVSEVLKVFQATAISKRLRLTVDVLTGVPHLVLGDKLRLRHVLANSNAASLPSRSSIIANRSNSMS